MFGRSPKVGHTHTSRSRGFAFKSSGSVAASAIVHPGVAGAEHVHSATASAALGHGELPHAPITP